MQGLGVQTSINMMDQTLGSIFFVWYNTIKHTKFIQLLKRDREAYIPWAYIFYKLDGVAEIFKSM